MQHLRDNNENLTNEARKMNTELSNLRQIGIMKYQVRAKLLRELAQLKVRLGQGNDETSIIKQYDTQFSQKIDPAILSVFATGN